MADASSLAPLALVAGEVAPPLPRATIHSLPTELIHHIIKLSLPRPRFATFRERHRTLRACCLLCRSWHALASRELWRNMWLSRPSSYAELQASLQDFEPSTATRVLAGVESLRCVHRQKDEALDTQDVMRMLPSCKELWVYGCASQSPLEVSAFAFQLERLHMDWTAVQILDSASPTTPAFPHLVDLSFSEVEDKGSIVTLLHPRDLPVLRNLTIFRCAMRMAGVSLGAAITALAPRLERLTLLPRPLILIHALRIDWTVMDNLKKLALPCLVDSAAVLSALPSPLTTFRVIIIPDFEPWEGISTAFRQWPTSLHALRELELRLFEAKEIPADVLKVCSDNGVQVAVKAHPKLWFSEWEDSVLSCKRCYAFPCARR